MTHHLEEEEYPDNQLGFVEVRFRSPGWISDVPKLHLIFIELGLQYSWCYFCLVGNLLSCQVAAQTEIDPESLGDQHLEPYEDTCHDIGPEMTHQLCAVRLLSPPLMSFDVFAFFVLRIPCILLPWTICTLPMGSRRFSSVSPAFKHTVTLKTANKY